MDKNNYKDMEPESTEGSFLRESDRTIQEVFDVKTGDFILAEDFFKQSEDVIIRWRRHLAEAALMNEPRLVCSHCNQMVKLSGRKTDRGRVVYFSHLYNSDDCDIKTGINKSKEEILAEKYGKVSESERHQKLKHLISTCLSTRESHDMGISNVAVEKRITSPLPYLNYRRPDISANYKNFNIVFELQLSTTFLNVVVDRDIFYRLNNYFIIWVFNFDDNIEYVNLRNLMMKDIYYANKRNIFVFDNESQDKSLEENILYLHCMWMEEDGSFSKGKFVTLDDLSFDEETCKPYYIDADLIFYKLFPERQRTIEELERTRKSIVDALMKRMADDESRKIERLKEELLHEAKMKEVGETASPFRSLELWGFKHNEIVITQPQFDLIEKVDTDNYIVTKGNKKGIVNKYGRLIVNCDYNNVISIFEDVTLIHDKMYWKIYNSEKRVTSFRKLDTLELTNLNTNVRLLKIKDGRKKAESDKLFILFRDASFIEITEIKNEDEIWMFKTRENWHTFKEITSNGLIIENRKDNLIIARTGDGKFGLLDNNYKALTTFTYDLMEFQCSDCLRVLVGNKYGLITHDECVLFDIKYYDATQLGPDTFKLRERKDDWINVVKKNGDVYFSVSSYSAGSYIEDLEVQIGQYIVFRSYNYKRGLIDFSGKICLKADYSNIKSWNNEGSKIMVQKSWRDAMYGEQHNYGFLNNKLEVLVPCDLKELNIHNDGNITSCDYNNVYIFDNSLNVIFTAFGTKIKSYSKEKNYVIVETNFRYCQGDYYLSIYSFKTGGIQCKERFYSIEEFVDNIASVKIYREDGLIKEGKIDSNFQPILCDEEPLGDGFYKGTLLGRYGIRNTFSNTVIPYKYTDIKYVNYGFIATRGEKSQYVHGRPNYYDGKFDISGNKIPEKIIKLSNGLYKVLFQGLYGIIDENNNVIIPIKYKDIESLNNYLFKVRCYEDYTYKIIDIDDKILIDNSYLSISIMENGYIKFTNEVSTRGGIHPAGMGGFMSPDGKICVRGEFEGLRFTDHKLMMKRNTGSSMVTDEGNVLSDEEIILPNGLIRIKQFGLYGLLNSIREIILPCQYRNIIYCEDIRCYVTNRESSYVNGITVILDEDFHELIVSENGDKITSYIGDNLFKIIAKGDMVGVINNKWEYIIRPNFNDIVREGDYFIVSKIEEIGSRYNTREINLFGIYTLSGHQFAYCQYRKVKHVGHDFWKVWYKDECKIMISPNQILNVDEITKIHGDLYKVSKNKKFGVINHLCATILPTKYDEIKYFNGHLCFLQDDTWIDFETKEIVDVKEHFKIGETYNALVSNIKNFGLFVSVKNIGTGLVHVSELKKIGKRPSDFKKGQEICVKVLSLREGKYCLTLNI